MKEKEEEGKTRLEETIADPSLSALEMLIKIESYERLSKEAKFVISIILNTPKELFDLITTKKTKKITEKSLKNFLINKWPVFTVEYVLKEIKNLIK